jgi:hypothetical protein
MSLPSAGLNLRISAPLLAPALAPTLGPTVLPELTRPVLSLPNLSLPVPAVPSAPADLGPAQAPAASPLEILKQAESASAAAVRQADEPEKGYEAGTSVFDLKAAAPAVDAGDGRAEASAGAEDEVPGAMEWLARLVRSPGGPGDASDPIAFRRILAAGFESMGRGPVAEPLARAKLGYLRGDASVIARTQNLVRDSLAAAARRHLDSLGIPQASVISNGTTLDKLLGMAYSGGMETTSSYQGMSGESAQFWGAQGTAIGASYGATRAASRRKPGVMIIIRNESNPIKVVQGETLSRQPLMDKDFLAAVVSDGVDTVVLDAAFLRSLAASALRWKEFVKTQAYKNGLMGPFLDWDAWGKKVSPDHR